MDETGLCGKTTYEFIMFNSHTAATVMCWFSWKTENVENQTGHFSHKTAGGFVVCNRPWSFRFQLDVCVCWWQCCRGTFVDWRKLLKKFIESLFFYENIIRSSPITIVIQNMQIIANMCKQTSFPHQVYKGYILTLKIASRSRLLNLEDLKSNPFHGTRFVPKVRGQVLKP